MPFKFLENKNLFELFSVSLTIALVGLGIGCVLPLTSLALNEHGVNQNFIGWTIAANAIGGLVGTFCTPYIAISLGRKKTVLCSLVLSGASVGLLQYFNTDSSWIILRFIFGFSIAALFLIGEAWINVLSTDESRGRFVAIYSTSFTFLQVFGPVITDFVTHFPDRQFLLCGFVFALGLPAVMFCADDRTKNSNTDKTIKTSASAMSWWKIFISSPRIVAATAFFSVFEITILGFLPIFALEKGFSTSRALAAPTILLLGDATLQYVFGWLSDRFGRLRIQNVCGLLTALLLPFFPLVIKIPVVWEVFLFVLGGVSGAIYTLSMVEVGERFTGIALLQASGLVGFTWNAASFIGAVSSGYAMQTLGSASMFLVVWAMAMLFRVMPAHKVMTKSESKLTALPRFEER